MGKYPETDSKTLLPLWVQVVLAFTLITITVTFISGIVVRKPEEATLLAKLESQAKKTVALIAASALDAVISEDIPLLETIVHGVVQNDPEIISLSFQDEEGTMLIAWHSQKELPQDRLLTFTQDVIVEDEKFGKIFVVFDQTPLLEEIKQRVSRVRTFLIIALSVLALLTLLAVRLLIVRPIQKINMRLQSASPTSTREGFSRLRPLEFERLDRLVTSRLQTEELLLKERNRSVQIIRESPVMVYGILPDKTVSFVNPAFEKVTGYRSNELVGKIADDLTLWRESRGRILETVNQHQSNATQHDFEEQLTTKDGEIRTILWHHLLKKNKQGDIEEIIGFGNDITARQQAEVDILKAKEEWERTFNSISDIVMILDTEMRVVRVNKSATDFLRKEQKDIIGKHCYELFQSRPEICENCPERLTSVDFKTHHAEVEFINGKTFYVSTSSHVDETGKFIGIVHTAKDITDQKMLEAQLLQSQKMEAIGTLAGGIAHDFNNILAAILGYTELALLEEGKSNKLEEYLIGVREGGQRAKELVSQILAFSRQHETKREPIDATVIIKETLKLIRASLPATIEIKSYVSDNPGKILADPTQIHQVLMNLCSNAAYAMKNKGGVLEISLNQVEIRTENEEFYENLKAGPHVRLEVKDTGAGMSAEVKKRIFEPFFTTKEKEKGTGMGLAAVHGIVKSHDGHIEVDSEPGTGTTFHIYFPVVSEVAQQLDKSGVFKSPPTGNETVLLVDDEEPIIEMGKRMLQFLGYNVITSKSGAEALQIFRSQDPTIDLIITDQTMPGMTGIELAQQVLHDRPDMPIILCTGYSESVNEENITALGIKGYMLKPMMLQNFAETIRSVLTIH